jgi:hypothetical protein
MFTAPRHASASSGATDNHDRDTHARTHARTRKTCTNLHTHTHTHTDIQIQGYTQTHIHIHKTSNEGTRKASYIPAAQSMHTAEPAGAYLPAISRRWSYP